MSLDSELGFKVNSFQVCIILRKYGNSDLTCFFMRSSKGQSSGMKDEQNGLVVVFKHLEK